MFFDVTAQLGQRLLRESCFCLTWSTSTKTRPQKAEIIAALHKSLPNHHRKTTELLRIPGMNPTMSNQQHEETIK